MPETRTKQKHRRPELRKHRIPLGVFHSDFFRHYATFFEVFFWIPPKGLPFVCFNILQHNGCQKFSKGPPFYIFRHCDTVQMSVQNLFIFCNQLGVSQSPEGPPFTILSLRYSADVGRSRLVSRRFY